jgi:hypothetical protein
VNYLKIQALACATLVMALTNGSAAAQAATDVVCSQCIGSSDIANEAVGSAKIKEGSIASNDIAANAVKSVNIGNGAITYGKLSPVLRDQLDGTLNHIRLGSRQQSSRPPPGINAVLGGTHAFEKIHDPGAIHQVPIRNLERQRQLLGFADRPLEIRGRVCRISE